MPFNDLREFITYLEGEGELIRTQKPVNVKYEISAYIRKTSDEQGPALLFDNVTGFDMPVLHHRALIHGVTAGADSGSTAVQVWYLASGLAIVFFTFFRILAARSRPRPAPVTPQVGGPQPFG